MYSFGNKRKQGDKAKQRATVERVAPIQTVILSEKQLEGLTDLICNHMRDQLRSHLWHKQRWKSPDLKPSTKTKLPALDQLRRSKRDLPIERDDTQLVPEPSKKGEREPEKKTRSQRSQYEEDVEDPIQQTTSRPETDIQPINEVYKPDLKELSNKSTFSTNSTHEGVTEKKNWVKSSLDEEVIQLSSGQSSNESEGDQRLHIEGFQSNHGEPSCKPTCFGKLILQRSLVSLIDVQIPYGLKVTQLLNQEMLSLPYLEAHGFKHLQTRLWRPGEAYNHSGDMDNHPGGSSIILEGSDLRTNPFKGGGDGVIQISLNFKDLKVNYESSNQDHFSQSNRYDGHFGRANTHLVHAESRDGRNSLLPDRSELVRPPEQLPEVQLVLDEPRHVSAQQQSLAKAQKAQEDIKDELGFIMKKPRKMFVEQSPYWPIKLKDRPPWAIFVYLGFLM